MNDQPASLLQKITAGIKKTLLITGFFSIVINLLMLATPLYMLQVYDRVLISRSVETLLLLTLIVIAALIVSVLLERIRSDILQRRMVTS